MVDAKTKSDLPTAQISNLPPDVAELLRMGGSWLVGDGVPLDNGDTLFFVGNGLKTERVSALNPKLPEFVTERVGLIEPASFEAYITAFKSATAVCKASLGQHQIVCVLDYHGAARMGDRDDALPGRAFTVTLSCPYDADYAKWRGLFGKLVDQATLSDFIEDLIHTVHTPAAADLLEAISDVEIERAVKFKSRRNYRTGTVSIAYSEDDTSATSTVEMPGEIEIVVPIFQGGPTTSLKPKIRYLMEKGVLMFKLVLPGLELEEREAFRSIGEHVRENTSTPVFYAA